MVSLFSLFRTSTDAERLQKIDDQIRNHEMKRRRYNHKVNTTPSIINSFFMLTYVAACGVIFALLEKPISYYAMGACTVTHLLLYYLIRSMLRLYYNKYKFSSESSIEELIIRQREILEDVKQKNNYHTTSELVDKYERSIRRMENQINRNKNSPNDGSMSERSLSVYYDYLTEKTPEKVDVGVQTIQVQPQHRSATLSPKQNKPVVMVDNEAITTMMNMMNKMMRSKSGDVKFEDVSDVLALPPSSQESDSKKRRELTRSQSFGSFSENDITDDTHTKNEQENRRRSLSSTDKARIEQSNKLMEQWNALKEQQTQLRIREEVLRQRERNMDTATKPPLSPSSLYSPSSIHNYNYVPAASEDDVKSVGPKLGFFDRVIDKLIGQSPDNCIALICGKCFSHNGLMMIEDANKMTRFRCWECRTLNLHGRDQSNNQSEKESVTKQIADKPEVEKQKEIQDEPEEKETKEPAVQEEVTQYKISEPDDCE
ncbi:lspA [Acrasis kona]|uniref:Endoplasmic reticulum junction formation protein lunapark n=1 Tax=Acrasis kona TaxID=1008807 RepID=A0AAW2Z3U7_9EUKA